MSDYPIDCGQGRKLNESCASARKNEYQRQLGELARQFASAMSSINGLYKTAVANCSGNASCVAAASSEFADRVQAQLDLYDQQCKDAEKSYEDSLQDCCESSETFWQWVTSWF